LVRFIQIHQMVFLFFVKKDKKISIIIQTNEVILKFHYYAWKWQKKAIILLYCYSILLLGNHFWKKSRNKMLGTIKNVRLLLRSWWYMAVCMVLKCLFLIGIYPKLSKREKSMLWKFSPCFFSYYVFKHNVHLSHFLN